MKNTGGKKLEDKFLAVHHDGMTGIRAALVPRHNIEVTRQSVNDFALALVTPLVAQNNNAGRHVLLRLCPVWTHFEVILVESEGSEPQTSPPGENCLVRRESLVWTGGLAETTKVSNLEVLFEQLGEVLLRRCSDQLFANLPILKQKEGGDAANTETGRN